MGDPKHPKKKYAKPAHPWQGARIKEERVLMKEYGLKNKKELWKMGTILKKIKTQAKSLISKNDAEAQKEKELFLKRLARLGIISTIDVKLEDILGMSVKDILDRRLQSIFMKKGLAKSTKQARQFIKHRHVLINDKIVDIPSYLVLAEEEQSIGFNPRSALDSLEHPERQTKKQQKTEKAKEESEEEKEAEKVSEKLEEAKKAVVEEEKIAKIEAEKQ